MRIWVDKGFLIQGGEIEGPGGELYPVPLEFQVYTLDGAPISEKSYRGPGTLTYDNRLFLGDTDNPHSFLEEYRVEKQATQESWDYYSGFKAAMADKRAENPNKPKKHYAQTSRWWEGYQEGWREKRSKRKLKENPMRPGKFDSDLDEAIYELTLDGGTDEVAGDVHETGLWCGLMRDGNTIAEALKGSSKISFADRNEVERDGSAGLIITEDSQGFVKVFLFKDPKKLEAEWRALEADNQVNDFEANSDSRRLNEFQRGFLDAALWSTNYESDGAAVAMDQDFSIDDIAEPTLKALLRECDEFEEQNAADLESGDSGQAGHDFWLTRNRHGAGFWDGDWPEPQAKRLTDAAHAFGQVDLYVGDDGKIYAMGYETGTKFKANRSDLRRDRIQEALSYVHYYERPERGDIRMGRAEAAKAAIRISALNEEEQDVLLNALHVKRTELAAVRNPGKPPPPPPRRKSGGDTLRRVHRMAHQYQATEKPFDPAERHPRETKAHHFAVNSRQTRWSDAMILDSVRDGQGLSGPARQRALELARQGLIDTSGTWTLTRAGHARSSRTHNPDVNFGTPYGGAAYRTQDGRVVHLFRKGQKCRFYDDHGHQVGPEQKNVAPAMAYAVHQGWHELR